MKLSELTKYQKSRMCNCIYCGQEITNNQEFEFCTTRYKRYNIYTFIHSDCMVKAHEWLRQFSSNELEEVDDGK